MIVVDNTNIASQPFKNIKEVLATNSNSYKVRPVLTDSETLPVTVIETTYKVIDKKVGRTGTKTYIVTAEITAYGRTYEAANDLLTENTSLLENSALEEYNMSQHDFILSNNNVFREDNVIRGRRITVQYVVR